MCLKLRKNSELIKTKEPIIVYKVYLKQPEFEENIVAPPFRNSLRYNISKTLRTVKINPDYKRGIVGEGYHSLENLNDAIQVKNFYFGPMYQTKLKIYKCIIPRGAYRIKGFFNHYASFVSSSLKVIEEIKI